MKKITTLLLLFAVFLTACEGDPGPQGPPGLDGVNIVGSAFEIVVDFNEGNDYSFIEPYGFEVFPSDVTLVYIEWEVEGGEPIWRLLPQTVYFDEGILTYNFDFTQQDVQFFLDGTIDFSLLGPEWTQDQAFRVVVVPADNVDGVDVSDFNTVMELNNIQTFDIR